ncbi:MAG: class I SAM-dependent methyltransferase [Azoarcus sp.]|nr:class I SAM-dependent methyltransferase [Azoarcus sp.]
MRQAQEDRVVYSLAFVIHDNNGATLYGKRHQAEVSDYKNFWSLPSIRLSESEFHSILGGDGFNSDICDRLSNYLGATVKFDEILIHGERIRSDYFLHQLLVRAQVCSSLAASSFKYESLRFLSPEQVVSMSNGRVGTCISLYFQYLIDNKVLPTTFEYLEVPPEVADGSLILECTDSEALWKLAGPNYKLLLNNKTGTDGAMIRSLSLDRYIDGLESQCMNQRFSVLDVGCGNGAFVERLALGGINVLGIDLNKTAHETIKDHIIIGNASRAKELLNNQVFDVILANLVFEWIEDLSAVFNSLAQCLTNNGRIIATFTHPEFSHAGSWVSVDSTPQWIQKKSPRRAHELVMINRCAGPVRYYPRGTDQIITLGCEASLNVCGMKDLYLDTYLDNVELASTLKDRPQLVRHMILPLFRIIEFTLAPSLCGSWQRQRSPACRSSSLDAESPVGKADCSSPITSPTPPG